LRVAKCFPSFFFKRKLGQLTTQLLKTRVKKSRIAFSHSQKKFSFLIVYLVIVVGNNKNVGSNQVLLEIFQ
jgi:hypothetical protein